MKSITLGNYHLPFHFEIPETPHRLFVNTQEWIKARETIRKYYRMGIAHSGVLIKVIVAALMIVLSAASGASPLIYTIGIFFAFLVDALAFANVSRKWIVAGFISSVLVNLSLGIYFIIHIIR